MSIRPEYITVGDLFSRNYVFRVPRYQRGYAWEEAEVDDFLKDVTACYNLRVEGGQREHFFGGIVAVERDVTGSAGHHCDLIDGQQRIATFVMLASCLEKLFLVVSEAANSDGDSHVHNLASAFAVEMRSKYLEFNDVINREPCTVNRLEMSNPDQPYFAELIQHESVPEPPGDGARESHGRLWRAYKTLYDDLEYAVEQSDSLDAQVESLSIVRDILLHDATVINILTDQEAEAYRLFQVLNNRGTKLTEGDLLRASTLELLGIPALRSEHETAAGMWDRILEHDPIYTRNFLGWYFASLHGRRAGQSSLFDEFFAELFSAYGPPPISRQNAKQVVKVIREIEDANLLCRQLLDGEWPYSKGKAQLWDVDRLQLIVNFLDHTACVPLLLAAALLEEKKFLEVVSLTERFAFRFKSVCNLHIGSLQRVYHEQALLIRRNPKTYSVASLRGAFKALQDDKATDTLFAASLSESLVFQSSSGNKLIKYFLGTIEHYLHWYENGASGRPKCRDTTRVFDLTAMTVEHIYPQNPKAKDRQLGLDPLANKLGNLTILGQADNDAVGNKPFLDKKPILQKSSLRLNRAIAEEADWKRKQIDEREQNLIEIALKVFSM